MSKQTYTLRSRNEQHKPTTTGVLPPICIFCNKVRREIKDKEVSLINCEFDRTQKSVKEAARILNDGPLLAKIGDIDFYSKQVKYHNECKRAYMDKVLCFSSKQDTVEQVQVSQSALESLFSYIETSVIDKNRPKYLTSLHHRYCDMFERKAKETESKGEAYVLLTINEKIQCCCILVTE